MANFVSDSSGLSWVVFAPSRIKRPEGEKNPAFKTCPFCPGQESLNSTILQIPPNAAKNTSWDLRVIANKYPITDYHEVIIHTPEHSFDVPQFKTEKMAQVLTVYRDRYNFHVQAGHGKVIIFYNHNVHAGASLSHSHSQLVVISQNLPLKGPTKQPEENIVFRSSHFTLYCPRFSAWPYELWVSPVVSGKTYGEISDQETAELAKLIPRISSFIVTHFIGHETLHKHEGESDVPFNYYFYHGKDWFLRFLPRLIHPGGFELASSMTVNIVNPEKAAREYRQGLIFS